MSRHEDVFDEATIQRRRFMKYAGIGIGATAALFPVAYLVWRSPNARIKFSRRIRGTQAPPPRRLASTPAYSTESGQTPGHLPLSARPALVADYVSEDGIMSFMPSMKDITQTTVFHAVKSFTLATLGVSLFAGTSVALLIWRWDLHNVSEFHEKMHGFIDSILPTHSSTVHRPFVPTQRDIETGGAEFDIVQKSMTDEAIENWTWEDAKARMAEAYEKDGPLAWTATMIREMELGNQQEVRKQNVPSKNTNTAQS